MNRYGIVAYPDGGAALHYPAQAVEHGVYSEADYDDEDVQNRRRIPVAIFFATETGRDRELQELVKRNAGIMFCPVTVNNGFKTQPNPKATQFEFSKQGILPV